MTASTLNQAHDFFTTHSEWAIYCVKNPDWSGWKFCNSYREAVEFFTWNTQVVEVKDTTEWVPTELTFWQEAVWFTFNPSWDPKVTQAKKLIADAIDLLEQVHQEYCSNQSPSWLRNVLRTNAFTSLVNAKMALVKYLTWKK